ncbi:MAG TPA: phospholipid carrier-dependent glycosyltransferase [Candidatus Dormibacteraeota bacterium]|nr:phospholipid carrier-dependent glycosyltransferase [Candidatus Dormibacteraeota bacterium]
MNNEKNGRHEQGFTAWLVAAGIFLCLFGQLGAIGLTGPDEPRYAWIARAMAQTGDWVTPRLYGQPWFEKPILYYWAAALGFKLHLSAEWAARLPSAFAALAAAIGIGWVAAKHYGGNASSLRSPVLLAPLIFASSVAGIGFARAATPDMLFSASIALAMAAIATVYRHSGVLRGATSTQLGHSQSDYIPLLLFGAFLGLGVLAKGPAAVIMAGGAIFIWALATKQWRAAFRAAHPVAIAAFCVVALPWYIVCALRNPDFLHVFIWQHNFERYLTPMFHHPQPFWFFGPVVLLALVPWTILLWPVAREGLRVWREKSWTYSPGVFFACWAIFPVAFFSFSDSKLPSYILPAIPPLALMCAIASVRAFQESRALSIEIAGGIGLTWIGLAIASWVFARKISWNAAFPNYSAHDVTIGGLVAVAAAVLFTLVLLFFGLGKRIGMVAGLSALAVVLALEIANFQLLPSIDPLYSARYHAQFMSHDLYPDRIFTYQLARSWNYGLAFYFHRQLPEWQSNDPRPALVLTTPAGLTKITAMGRFRGELDEPDRGILYVPAEMAPR